MTRAQALAELHTMIGSLSRTDTEAAAVRLLERISCRADAIELRSALVEEGARALLRQAGGGE
jgi:hypothetical protein